MMIDPSAKQSFRFLRRYLQPEWQRGFLLLVLLFGGIGMQLLQPANLA